MPIIYIQDDDVDKIGSPDWQIHPAIAPEEGDLVIRKPEMDAFYGTTLQQEMEACGIAHLIVVGCKSEVCVDATCRRATNLGYNVTPGQRCVLDHGQRRPNSATNHRLSQPYPANGLIRRTW